MNNGSATRSLGVKMRNSFRRTIVMAACAYLIVPAAAADPSVQHVDVRAPVESILSYLAEGPPESESLWKAVRAAPLTFKSNSDQNSDLACQLFADARSRHVPGIAHFAIVADERAGHRVASFLVDGRPVCVILDRQRYVLRPNGTWSVRASGPWALAFDAEHLDFGFDMAAGGARLGGHFEVDLASVLAWFMDDRAPKARWDPTSRTVVLDKNNGTVVEVRLRTPDDALRYGTALREVRFQGRDGGSFSARGFQVHSASPSRLRVERLQGLAERVEATPYDRAVDGDLGHRLGVLRGDGTGEMASTKMLREVHSAAWMAHAERPSGSEARLELSRTVSAIGGLDAKRILDATAVGSELVPGELAAELALRLQAIVDLVTAQTGSFPDDPTMIGQEVEAIAEPLLLRAAFDAALKLPTDKGDLTEHQIVLHDAIGDVGCPSSHEDGLRWRQMPRQTVLEAILWSRWGWPCEVSHIEATLRLLDASGPGSGMERVSVETLIRLDALDRISPTALDRWYMTEVSEAPAVRRRRSLALASVQRAGREWLMKRITLEADAGIRDQIASTLRGRATAALTARMFDYISEADCRQILGIDGGER